ncbi:type II secretion system protein [Oleiagrimonas sp. C23AA]|uniref:type IV pilus modification PilV family protein n=1 Tax=Oleiagrimonas sp. C23AA TaxID=2719047 RepID=UPI00141F8EAB|nr:type II secretion system protein [Oleiagrimonas sp. C23AA]NII12068.1 type II secretion system protein [Oleiagrimonas sp. C23AA]
MRAGHRGFTLLEMIGAIAIMAISFAVLLEALGSSMALTHKADRHSAAALVAQSVLDSAFVMSSPAPGVQHGHTEDGFDWDLQTRQWHGTPSGGSGSAPGAVMMMAQNQQLYRLDLTVRWGPQGRRRQAHFATLRLANTMRNEGRAR